MMAAIGYKREDKYGFQSNERNTMSWKMTLLSGMMVYCSFSTLTFATEQNTLRIGVNSGYAHFEV